MTRNNIVMAVAWVAEMALRFIVLMFKLPYLSAKCIWQFIREGNCAYMQDRWGQTFCSCGKCEDLKCTACGR